MKKILVQDGLGSIKDKLEERGYEIVDMDTGHDIEAIVYMENGINAINSSISEDSLSEQGAILINANGKTLDDIDNIINNKVYSPLGLNSSVTR